MRETGSAAPAQLGRHRPAALAGHEEELVRIVEAMPDIWPGPFQGSTIGLLADH